MNKLSYVSLIIVSSGLSACVDQSIEYNKMCSTWLGAPEHALIQGWGTPVRTYSVEDIKYITFRDSQIRTHPTSPAVVNQMWCETTFTIHNHTVIDFLFDGNRCIAPIKEAPDYNYTPMSAASEVF